jgi:choline dehydrogenase-like flavoprotein
MEATIRHRLRALRQRSKTAGVKSHFEPEETQMIRTIVIGSGVMGASVAYRLAQAGAVVTVLEATRRSPATAETIFLSIALFTALSGSWVSRLPRWA